jgi:cation diffusion facilitator CzcD-associated flavoprotein CzcO
MQPAVVLASMGAAVATDGVPLLFEAMVDVLVIGAGPGGLAAARELGRRGASVLVIERTAAVGGTWRGGYDSLRLNTVRSLSHLPGGRLPRRLGRWVPRGELLRYLDDYVSENRLEVKLETEARRLERCAEGWEVDTSAGPIEARCVVVATGECNTPRIPPWPGRFSGRLLHSADYRRPDELEGGDVLVVGAGNSGAEIAVELVGIARRVRLAVRTPPQIVPRTVAGIPTNLIAVVTRRVGLTDPTVRALQRLCVPDLERFGLPRSTRPASRQFAEHRVVPIFTLGSYVDAVSEGRVEIVKPVTGFDGARVLLEDGAVEPEVVIAATGYDCGLEQLVGHLGVLSGDGLPLVTGGATHPAAPGLYFTGFTNPITGNLRELRLDARRIGRAHAAPAWRRRRWPISRHPQPSVGQGGAEPSRATAAP